MSSFYQSFLLRIWGNPENDVPFWQASLEDPTSHTIRIFNNPEDLYQFIAQFDGGATALSDCEKPDRT